MTFVLPYPPSTNTAYAVVRGRKIKTKKAREYADTVAAIAYQVDRDYTGDDYWTAGRLAVTLDMHAPDRRRRDLGNVEKLAVDAIAAQLGFDDSQIDVLTLRRQPVDRTNPRLVITVEPI